MRKSRLYLRWLVPLLSAAILGATGPHSQLIEAIQKTDKTAVRAALQKHADVNEPEPDGTTALHWAVRLNDLETADLLIRAGAHVKAVTRYGVTPLTLACVNGNAALIDRLTKAGADPN